MSDFISSGLNKKIDHLMDICFGAGVSAHQTIIEQLNYLFFIRALSKKDEEAEQLGISEEKVFVKELAKYNWDALLALNAEELFESLEKAFVELPKHTNNKTIQIVFANAHVKIYSKAALRQILHEIDKLESQLDALANKGQHDVFGDMYEYLLSKMSAAGSIGMFRTPRHIIKFMVEAVDPAKGQYILDPACGTAGFLVAAHTYLGQKYTNPDLYKDSGRYSFDKLSESERQFVQNKAFTGFDSGSEIIKFGLMNALLHDMHGIKLKRQNTLVDTTGDRTKYDVILANPPFAGKIDKSSVSEDIAMGTGATEILFLRYMLDHLSSKGKMAVIVPEGVIFSGSSAHKTIRKMLIEQGLYAVVSLPSGVFNPYAGVKTSILLLDNEIAKTKNEILFVKIAKDGYDLGAQRRSLSNKDGLEPEWDREVSDLPNAIDTIKAFRNGDEIKVANATVVEKQKLAESGDYNLNGDRYAVTVNSNQANYKIVELGSEIIENPKSTIKVGDAKKSNGKVIFFTSGREQLKYDTALVGGNNIFMATGGNASVFYYNGPASYSTDTWSFKSKDENTLLTSYIYYLLESRTKDINTSMFKGAGLKHLDKHLLRKFSIPLPPIEIQREIVAELDGYQKIINAAQTIVNTYKPTIKINPDWSVVKLNDVVNRLTDGSHSSPASVVEGKPYVTVKDVHDGQIDTINSLRISDEDYLRLVKNGCKPDVGDVLFSKDGTVGRVALVKRDIDFVVLSSLAIISPNSQKLDSAYLAYVLQDPSITAAALGMMKGIAIRRVILRDLKELKIPIPPMEIQRGIVAELEAERKIIEANKKLIEIYQKKIKEKISELWG